jgi:methylenetetrahydrofolate reductase (NADPH)
LPIHYFCGNVNVGVNLTWEEMMSPSLTAHKHVVEALTPAQEDPEFEAKLAVFAERYRRILDHGAVVSIPDNPIGHLHFTALEVIDETGLAVDPERVLLHLNTFHRKDDLDAFLRGAADRGVRYLLVVSGDGGPRLPKLEPEDLGLATKAVTSVELLDYIRSRYPSMFTCGVAYNQYEPVEHETEKLLRKLDAGAAFVITQPVIGADGRIARLMGHGAPVFVDAWMSRKIELVYQCAGVTAPRTEPGSPAYSPEENLRLLRSAYPTAGVYLSMLGMKKDWSALMPRLAPAGRA